MADPSLRPVVGFEDLSAWCLTWLGAPAAERLFDSGAASAVCGLRLADGREVVIKVRPASARLVGCFAVHRHLWLAGFACPEPLVGPRPFGDLVATAEELLSVTGTPAAGEAFLRSSAAGLARLLALAPHPDALPSVAPSLGCAGWDHDGTSTWPTPTDGSPDYNAGAGPAWADRVAVEVRARLKACRRPAVIGHGDWWTGNLVWDGRELLVVHDWDSVICQPEPAIVGNAAAELLGVGPQRATVEQSAVFVDAYLEERGEHWDPADHEVAWAAGLWARAFDAKEAALHGELGTVLDHREARARLELAGLNPDLIPM